MARKKGLASSEVLWGFVIRCSEHFIIQFQFKNFVSPVSASQIATEAAKCSLGSTWQSMLIVVCTAGHSLGDSDVDVFQRDGNIPVVVLARSSVDAFLGRHTVRALQPEESIISDTMRRLTVSTPNKSAADA